MELTLCTSLCHCSVNLHPSGREALLKLSKGDMRRALNVLQVRRALTLRPTRDGRADSIQQACHAAFDVVDETAVYACTGNPHPDDIRKVVESMMTQEFTTSYNCASDVMTLPL
jgi:replication factor C subunit 3/5